MSGIIASYDHHNYHSCLMRKDDIGAIYCFPYSEVPVCLVLYSPHILIPGLTELIALIELIEEASDSILKVQLFDSRVEFHFDTLDELSATLLATFLSSQDYCDIGDWAFKASDMKFNIRETMNYLKNFTFEFN